eukprot:TRINITY_DN254_c0_g1_i1.p1 TRINITY_DN254_c0_g1~~TRINITY_DN254_c0_g1_i1.p1  ORF type:complete len:139 (+),score=17.40 TRINITY_DN254_c0_g1_i1:220-636(+)
MVSTRALTAWVNTYSEFLRNVVPTYYREIKRAVRSKTLPDGFSIDISASDCSDGSSANSGPDSPQPKRKTPAIHSMRLRLSKRHGKHKLVSSAPRKFPKSRVKKKEFKEMKTRVDLPSFDWEHAVSRYRNERRRSKNP